MTLTRSHYTIGLNASRDLWEAGCPNDDNAVRAFEAAFRASAARLADAHGVTIDITTDASGETGDDDDEALQLWQAIHDATPAATVLG